MSQQTDESPSMFVKDCWVSIPMRSVINICNITSVIIGIIFSCSFSFSLTMDAHALNAPPARRMIGYQCTNPHYGKVFTNVFAYDQHRNHAIRAGTLCASIMMVKSSQQYAGQTVPRPFWVHGRAEVTKEMRTKSDAHRRVRMSLCRHVYQRPPSQIQTNSAPIEAML